MPKQNNNILIPFILSLLSVLDSFFLNLSLTSLISLSLSLGKVLELWSSFVVVAAAMKESFVETITEA